MDYLQSRYYSPEWGRFVNADEPSLLLFANDYLVGTNLFAYCANNPVMFCGPSGMGAIALRKRDWLAFLGFGLFTIAISPAVFAIAGLVIVGGLIVGSTQAGLNSLQNIIDATADLKRTAEKYGRLRCKEAAEAMKKDLLRRKQHGALILLHFPNARYGFVNSNKNPFESISENGKHWGVLYNGHVYCNVYPKGLPEKQWILSFYDATGEPPIVTKFPF